MSADRLLKVAAIYHAVVGLVLVLLPGDLFRSLGIDPPRYWLFFYAAATAPLLAAWLLEWARRRPALREGLCGAVMAGELLGGALILALVTWEDLPWPLLGPGLAAGLWAWLLWGVYSPEPREGP